MNYSMAPCDDISQKAINASGMDRVSNSLVASYPGSSKMSPVDATSDQMSMQSFLPSSIRAALSFVSGHATLEPLQHFPAYTDRAEFLSERIENAANLHCIGVKENPILHCIDAKENPVVCSIGVKENPIIIEDEHEEDLISEMRIHDESYLDSSMLEKRARNFIQEKNNYVYKRRKLRRNSLTLLPKQTQMACAKECWPHDKLGSSWSSLLQKKEISLTSDDDFQHDIRVFASPQAGYPRNLLQSGNKVINSSSSRFLNVERCKTCLVTDTNSKVSDGKTIFISQEGSSNLLLDSGKMDMNSVDLAGVTSGSRSVIDDCVSLQNQSNSSFEMSSCNLGKIAATTNYETTELAERLSSGIENIEASGEFNPEKEWCISVLKECGLLGWFGSSGEYAAAEHPGVVGDGSSIQICKMCGSLEDSTTTLICDMCEEAFHMSCCNPKVKSVPVEDEWYCPSCRKKRKRPGMKSLIAKKSSQSILKETCIKSDKSAQDKTDLFWRMLQDKEPYTTQVRIGKAFQADVPDWTGMVPNDAEILFMGEPLEKELAEQNLMNEVWSKGWEPAKPFLLGSIENWLQCRNVICEEGTMCLDGRKAKDVICGKWRRAPLTEIQNDDWDCSCAIVWDPLHADCAVPQELETEEILRRLKASELAKLQLASKRRKSKMKQFIAEEDRDRPEGRPRHL